MKLESARLLWCVTCLLLLCWTAQASEPEPTSRELLTKPLTAEEIASMLGPEDLYSGSELGTWLAEDLLPMARTVVRETAEEAAAAAVRPLLAELAGVTAERDQLVLSRGVWRLVAAGGVVAAVLAIVVAVVR